ncbi:hypothetical protein [Pseudomonas fluorescens]|uniref:hypothetical protein n=1 Tax=Pseudomonas fluorescens TaxID=294 RepID=UPI0020CA3719|nr:hypothetical protein [Pseudomonas fluorescens]
MWNSGVSGLGNGGGQFDAIRTESAPVAAVTEVAAVKKLLNELFEAEQGSKAQAIQGARDKLHALREQMGDEKFKGILNTLANESFEKFLDFLKRLIKEWFPDADDAAPPAPPFKGGGGGGRVNPKNFGGSEPMSNKPFSEGARHFHYKPDNSDPGKKPGMGREPGNIWSGFKQGPDGNCVTVSAIKAAMMQFGQKPTDVFKEVKEAGDGYDVKMKDGFELHLSRDELKQAARYAEFKGDDPAMMTDANFMYAASAKRAQMLGNGFDDNPNAAKQSFAHAMQSLNNGEMGWEALDRLGLKGLYRQSSSAELASGKLGVVDYGGHSMAVMGGRVELWGGRGGAPQAGNAYTFT